MSNVIIILWCIIGNLAGETNFRQSVSVMVLRECIPVKHSADMRQNLPDKFQIAAFFVKPGNTPAKDRRLRQKCWSRTIFIGVCRHIACRWNAKTVSSASSASSESNSPNPNEPNTESQKKTVDAHPHGIQKLPCRPDQRPKDPPW